MAQISPSLLAANFAALGQACRTVLDAGARMLHFDVMDGQFVPNISMGVPVLAGLHRALPEAYFDVHLMICRPLDYIGAFARAGAGIITIHLEAESPVGPTLAAIRAAGCAAGLSIRPGTPAEALAPYLGQLDLVLVMSVEPGFGGQSFQPAALEKLRKIKQMADAAGRSDLWIEVDGGVDLRTAPGCVAAGANLLVAGSAVFGSADPAAAVRALGAL